MKEPSSLPSASPPSAPRPASQIAGLLRNLAPVLAYYLADWVWGLRPAIVASAVWSMGDVALHLIRREPIDTLFKFVAGTTLVFGVIDLVCTQPWLFSYEPVVTNTLTAGFLVVLARGSLEPLTESVFRTRPDLRGDPEVMVRLRAAVWVMVVVTAVKVPLYLAMAWRLPVERAMNLRTVVGNVSLVLALGVIRFGLEPLIQLGRRLGWAAAESSEPT